MMTEEQRKKAEIALNTSFAFDFEKKIAFDNHLKAIEWISIYNLPYRVSLDYLKGSSREYVQINPCYPFPGYNVNDLIHLKPNEFTPHDPSKPPNKDGSYNLCLTPINAEVRQQIKEQCEKLRPWNLSTQEGKEKWKYYFAHFLNAIDLESYNSFDWFGVKVAAYTEEQNKKINFWKCLQADFFIHPEDYLQEEPPYLPSYDYEYTHLEFIPDWDSNIINESM